jgi:uncharacterized damage-inducible protein DinB
MTLPVIDMTLQLMDLCRERTLGTLTAIEKLPDPAKALGWRLGPGRAHIAWQMMHIGITEEIFATDRFLGTQPGFPELLPRFKGGSTPDDNVPTLATIRDVLAQAREHFRDTARKLTAEDLARIPEAFKERGVTIGKALQIIVWHEAHHQGQAHSTLNAFKALSAAG